MRTTFAVLFLAASLAACTATTDAGEVTTGYRGDAPGAGTPSLVVSDEPAPGVIYRPGSRDTIGDPDMADMAPVTETRARKAAGGGQTLVARKAAELEAERAAQGGTISQYQDRLRELQRKYDGLASGYYSLVASINTELQSGSTAGNPVLTERWNEAQAKLQAISQSTGGLNALASDITGAASRAAWLQESVQAAYGLTGAVKEDHARLQRIEDDVNQDIVALNRLLTAVNDEINRRAAYLRAENLNMQTLSHAIATGELYGQSMANSLFRRTAEEGRQVFQGPGAAPGARRPLVVIRFDRPKVDYEQAVYTAVSQALDKYPAAKFDLVAVSASEGNPAELALAAGEARKNGEAVLRALTQMGLPMERIRLGAASSRDVVNSEVHIYIQ